MDGAILVVSAGDGPMPQIDGESLAIDVSRATINRAGVVQFEGTATVSTGRVVLDRYPITGSAQSSTADGDNYDLIWDILGSTADSAEALEFTGTAAVCSPLRQAGVPCGSVRLHPGLAACCGARSPACGAPHGLLIPRSWNESHRPHHHFRSGPPGRWC